MPDSWTYITTEVLGSFAKRRYKSHNASTLRNGRVLIILQVLGLITIHLWKEATELILSNDL